ncbi:DNA-binding Lrp family transcriptional regulator [Paucibacter oligotrophus]|uniref:DNA-binding Lrp family transcriptional regulator n=1 Tax=Roseateles oligotrophus TaxID=1769250 RepID=A0A840L9T6_9BURK|nr:Lrp/AsnC family transcriptional regulator [Roseateles oligotrophus]MBB4842958.1 DNA-binding Lrp family transcriptional regulator [Roseateles oligotrophus]
MSSKNSPAKTSAQSKSRPAPKSRSQPLAPAVGKEQVDRQLITLLQANARASTAELARKLGVARTTVVARLARLEASGTIVGYTARLGTDAADRGVQAFVGITVSPKAGREVVQRLSKIPELRQLASVSGEFDYMALLRAESTMRLDALLDEIGEIEGVIKTTSSVVLALRVDRSA